MKRNNLRLIPIGVLFLLFLIIVVGRFFYHQKKEHYVMSSYNKVLGRITSFEIGYAAGAVYYQYFVDGLEYTGEFGNNKVCTKFQKEFCDFDRYVVPILYSTKDPSVSIVLLRHKDFERLGVSYPDSIREVIEYYFECSYSSSAKREERNIRRRPKWRDCD